MSPYLENPPLTTRERKMLAALKVARSVLWAFAADKNREDQAHIMSDIDLIIAEVEGRNAPDAK